MGKLVFIDEKHAGREYALVSEKTTVGRSDENKLVIHDASISAHHCEILVNGPEVIVRDLGSRNGTLVNGIRLRDQQSQLKHGQTVRFGSVEARLELEPPDSDTGDHTATEMTAVHAMGRFLRQQEEERAHPKPADVSLNLDADSPQSGEETVINLPSPQPSPPPRPNPPPPTDEAKAPARGASGKALAVAVVALVLGLILLVWFLRRGR